MIDVGGARLHYELAGAGEPVVLIHGFAFDLRCWDPQVPALTREARVLRYDLRGFGRSTLPTPGVPYRHTADLLALLDWRTPRASTARCSASCARCALDTLPGCAMLTGADLSD